MKSHIHFEKNLETQQLNVTIETERLTMGSTTDSHFCDYKKLFTTPENRLKVMDGNPWRADKIGEQEPVNKIV
ncbi:MAG: hypothetical protein WAL30_01130 [Candidatus Aquirickettsiella sp.]